MRYPFVLFDLDGTLIDSARDLVASVQHALRKVDGREPPDPADILALVGSPLEKFPPAFGYPSDPASLALFVLLIERVGMLQVTRVLAFAAGLDPRSSDFPVSGAFLPLAHQAVKVLGRGTAAASLAWRRNASLLAVGTARTKPSTYMSVLLST